MKAAKHFKNLFRTHQTSMLIKFKHLLLMIGLMASLKPTVFAQAPATGSGTQSVIQTPTQTIRGRVYDTDSKFPITGAIIQLVNTEGRQIATQSDPEGNFRLAGVPVGRQVVRVTMTGYQPRVFQNLLIVAGKELELDVALEEKLTTTDVVEVTAGKGNRNLELTEVKNEMSFVSSRGFNVEETMRYAGSRNDPSRMASNFAGVQVNNDGRNDIIIRGNSPSGMLWRLEGLDIPNPSHFGAVGATGGPVTMLNNNVLAKSDFFTSAFPAEYGNAYSGAFDLSMRQGNRDKYEFLGQVGFNGFEVGAEGPLGKRGSFLANYRYSTIGLVSRLGVNVGTGAAVPNYQDLTFKVSHMIGKHGKLDVFAIGGLSDIRFEGKEADTTNLYRDTRSNLSYNTNMGVVGASYYHFFGPNTWGKFTVGVSGNSVKTAQDSLGGTDRSQVIKNYRDNTWNSRYSLRYNMGHKFNAKASLTAGLYYDILGFRFQDSVLAYANPVPGQPRQTFMRSLRNSEGSTDLVQAYGQFQYRFTEQLTANAGLHLQRFGLNGATVVEPRANARYAIDERSNLSLGYGLHSQMQPLAAYFARIPAYDQQGLPLGYTEDNKSLGFTQSHHLVLGYNRVLGSHTRLRSEIYYQDIFNVPVETTPSAYSMLNYGADFNYPQPDALINKGKGQNYGLEVTVERTFSKGYYYLLTGSIYDSRYQGSDGVWRNTGFNSKWLVNALAGYEVQILKGITLAFDGKVTTGGGRYYTPFDQVRSQAAGIGIRDEANAYSARFEDYFRLDLKVTLRQNMGKITQEFFVDVQNVTNRQNPFAKGWNADKNRETTIPQLGLFPNVNYRIVF